MKETCLMVMLCCDGDDSLPENLLSVMPNAEQVYLEPGLKVLRVAPGVLIQFYRGSTCLPEHIANSCGTLVSFHVDDLNEALGLFTGNGAEILMKCADNRTGFSFCHLKLPNGTVVGLFTG